MLTFGEKGGVKGREKRSELRKEPGESSVRKVKGGENSERSTLSVRPCAVNKRNRNYQESGVIGDAPTTPISAVGAETGM